MLPTTNIEVRAPKRVAFWIIWMFIVWSGVVAIAQPCQAQTIIQLQTELLNDATTQAKSVWNSMGFPSAYSFNSAYVSMAYQKLVQIRTQADGVATYARSGGFLHLVEEAVMLNAAAYKLKPSQYQLFRAVHYGFGATDAFAILTRIRYDLGKQLPHDPNVMSGPVSLAKSTNMPEAFDAPGSPIAATPYSYTIQFENDGAAAATTVTVTDPIDSTQQQINSFVIGQMTWNSNLIYPVAAAKSQAGPYSTILAGSPAPVPVNLQTLYYKFSNGAIMTIGRKDVGTTAYFTWTFPGWMLNNGVSGSVAFHIYPFVNPSVTNVHNAGATVTFLPGAGMWTTNPWIRPGTTF